MFTLTATGVFSSGPPHRLPAVHMAVSASGPTTEVDLLPLIRQIDALGRDFETSAPCRVILYNDEIHEFTDVMRIVMLATGCASQRAYRITEQAHREGAAVAFEGSPEECQRVGAVFERAALRWHLQ